MLDAAHPRIMLAALAVSFFLVACDEAKSETGEVRPDQAPEAQQEDEMTLKLTSPAFDHEAEIPRKYTCEGDDVSPPLQWSGVPNTTKSFALIVSDPDAPDPANPQRTWVHWILYDIPADTRSLEEAIGDVSDLPAGTRQGTNDWGRTGYGGPCPPVGRHRYFLRLFALDTLLGDRLGEPNRSQLRTAIEDHVVAQADLLGTYEKGE